MKKREIIFVALFVFSLINFVSAQQYYDDYSDVMLVCNANSTNSQDICNYFIEKRVPLGFNISHVVNLTNVSTSETITDAEYSKILTQINSSLQTAGEINYIVTTKGVPLKTGLGKNCNYRGTDFPTYCRSIDSLLMTNLGATTNYYAKEDLFTKDFYGGYLITRLTGVTSADAKRLIDNSDLAVQNGISGEFLINCYGGYGDYHCVSANTTLTNLGENANFTNTSFVKNKVGLAGYMSWGSNACGIGSSNPTCANSSAWNLSFVPGALAETYVSTGGRTFNTFPWTSGQSLVSDLIRFNVTGVKAYVYEPYLTAIAQMDIVYGRYLQGYNLADSFYMGSQKRNWMDVVIGDPKTYVSINSDTSPAISLINVLNGERFDNDTIINLSLQKSKFADFDSVWYSINGGSNISFETDNYTIDTASLSYGNYNVTIFSNNTLAIVSSKDYSFEVNHTIGTTPSYSIFSGDETTDIKSLEDKENVSGLVLQVPQISKIEFLEPVNVSGLDLDSSISMSEVGSISLNSTEIPNLNVSANITFYNNPSSSFLNPVILRDRLVCNATTSPACYNLTPMDAETVIFNVSSWSEYEIAGDILTGCAELNQPITYTLLNNITTTTTCFNITSDNVTLEGNGFTIDGGDAGRGVVSYNTKNLNIRNLNTIDFLGGIYLTNVNDSFIENVYSYSAGSIVEGYGFYIKNSNNISISNSFIKDIDGVIATDSAGLLLLFSKDITVTNVTIQGSNRYEMLMNRTNESLFQDVKVIPGRKNTVHGFMIYGSNNNIFYNSNISLNRSNQQGIRVDENSNNNYFENVTFFEPGWGMIIYNSSNNYVKNLVSNHSLYQPTGIEGNATNNTFDGISSYFDYCGFVLNSGGTQTNNHVKNIFVINATHLGWAFYTLAGTSVENYLSYYNEYSQIDFTNGSYFSNITINNPNLTTEDIIMGDKFVYLNSTALPELNTSANLTFYFGQNNFSIPYIAKDSVACSDCVNFTSLTADTVEFNVSSFSAYSLVENDTTAPNLTYLSNYITNQSSNVSFNVSDDGRMKNCSYSIGSLTNSTESFSNPNSLFITGLTAGTDYSLTLKCYDYAGNYNSSWVNFTTSENPSTGSSGGGSPSLVVSEGALQSGEVQSLSFGTKLTFNYKTQSHTIMLRNIDRDKAEISIDIYSEKKTISLGLNETKEVDLDGDGKADVRISLLKIYEGLIKVDLKIEEIKEVSEEKEETVVEKIVDSIKENDKTWVGFVVVLLIILGILGVVLIKRKR